MNNSVSQTAGSKEYWLILDNYVYLSIKREEVLLYNPLNGSLLEYKNNPVILKLAKRLLSPHNLNVIKIPDKALSNPVISAFIADLREHVMADLVDTAVVKEKPVQMIPIVKVHRDAEVIKKHASRSVGEGMMQYPAEMTLYINSNCALGCSLCNLAYKQFLCCTRGKSRKNDWPIETIKNILDQLQSAPLRRLNIAGGNILLYPHLEQLPALLESQSHIPEKLLVVHYLNLFNQDRRIQLFPSGCASFFVLVSFPVNSTVFEAVVHSLRRSGADASFQFIVSGEEDVVEAEQWINMCQIENYSLLPFFNGANQAFFSDNIFLEREDLIDDRPTQTQILARQVVNTLHFGQLTILDNGAIHGNVNTPRLGTLKSHSLYQAVHREMVHGKNWRRIRARVKPCRSCHFNALCPPLSNYEYALGKNNLCHIWQD